MNARQTAPDWNAMMLLINSLNQRMAALEEKLDAFYNNGISQAKRDLELMNVSLRTMSETLKDHLNWHQQHSKASKYVLFILSFTLGMLANKLGPSFEALIIKLFNAM
ncbi:MAG: hypothetical protein QXU75_04805 [Candidatus Methanomethylicaceae archaeon]